MRHFRREVNEFDRGEHHNPMVFAQEVFKGLCDEVNWADLIAAGWIYLEDGGKALTFEDFRQAAEALADSEVVRDAIRHCPDRSRGRVRE